MNSTLYLKSQVSPNDKRGSRTSTVGTLSQSTIEKSTTPWETKSLYHGCVFSFNIDSDV